jgi:hypothetical protein
MSGLGLANAKMLLLKHRLTEAPLLMNPDESKTYFAVTDASDIGTGRVLLPEGHPLAYEFP